MADTQQLRGALARQGQQQPAQSPAHTVKTLIDRQMPAIQAALPKTITAERFARIVLTEVRKNPQLLQADPMSLLGAVMVVAQLGLEPGPLGHAYLVPFRNRKRNITEVTPIIGYRGIVELARRSGQIESIVARPVHERDEFDFSYGLDETLHHKPALTDRGDAFAYYGVAKYRDGGHTIMVMSREDVERHRDRYSAGANRDDSPWRNEFDAMACKTVIRQMAKWLPMTTDLANAVAVDEQPAPMDLSTTVDDHAAQVEAIDVTTSDRDGQEPEAEPEPEPAKVDRPLQLSDDLTAALDEQDADDRKPTKGQTGKLEALLTERGFAGDVLRHAAFDVAYAVQSRDDLTRGQVSALIDVLGDEGLARQLLEAANELLVAEEDSDDGAES